MLPETGKISMKDVNVELERTENSKINLNEEKIRKMSNALAGKISLNNLHNKHYVNYFKTKHSNNVKYKAENTDILEQEFDYYTYSIAHINNMDNLLIGINSNFEFQTCKKKGGISPKYEINRTEGNLIKYISLPRAYLSEKDFDNNLGISNKDSPEEINISSINSIQQSQDYISINIKNITNEFTQVYYKSIDCAVRDYIIKIFINKINNNIINIKLSLCACIYPGDTTYIHRASFYHQIGIAQYY